MKVTTKLAGGYGLLVFVLLALLTYHISIIQRTLATNRLLSDLSARLELGSTAQLRYVDRVSEFALKFLASRDAAYATALTAARDSFEIALDGLRAAPLTDVERAQVEDLVAVWDSVSGLIPRPNIAPVGGMSAEEELERQAALAAGFSRLRAQTEDVTRATQRAIRQEVAASARAVRAAVPLSWGAALVALVVSLVIAYLVVRSISESLRRLRVGTRAVASGNFAHRIAPLRDDEFHQLSTSFNAMTRRLAELDRVKRDFVSHVSHELKTPLASMQETTQVMLEELPGPLRASQRRLLELNLRALRRLSSMITKLLDLSRMEAGAADYEMRSADLAEIVDDVVEAFESRTRETDHLLEVDLPARPVPVLCDPDRIMLVVQNLLDNAVKYSPPRSRIRVRVRHAAEIPPGLPPQMRARLNGAPGHTGFATLAVADQGAGIPDEHKQRIFERFHQVRGPSPKPGKGIGLGLALSSEVVESHGGAIWVEDGSRGGSVFHLVLRAHRVGAPAGAPAVPA